MTSTAPSRTERNGAALFRRVAVTGGDDIGTGIVRLTSKDLRALSVSENDVLVLRRRGSHRPPTPVIANRDELGDEGGFIRVDPIVRLSVGVGIGDEVEITRFIPSAPSSEPCAVRIGLDLTAVESDPKASAVRTFLSRKGGFTVGEESRNELVDIVCRKLLGRYVGPHCLLVLDVPFRYGGFLPVFVESVESGSRDTVVQVKIGTKLKLRSFEGAIPKELLAVREVPLETLKPPNSVLEVLSAAFHHAGKFRGLRGPPRGILLHGAPGTGKTEIVRALCREMGAELIELKGTTLMSSDEDQIARAIEDAFARTGSFDRSIVFIDEIETLTPRRDSPNSGPVQKRAVTTLLTVLSKERPEYQQTRTGANRGRRQPEGRFIVMAATNMIHELDPALRRPGRFDREVKIDLPDQSLREHVLERLIRPLPMDSEVDRGSLVRDIAARTESYTLADLNAVVREAVILGLWRRRMMLPSGSPRKMEPGFSDAEHFKLSPQDFGDACNRYVRTEQRTQPLSSQPR